MSGKANLSASVRARLRNRAEEDGADFMLVLTRYALERILYRLSISDAGGDRGHIPARETPLPHSVPVGLSREFCEDAGKQKQWEAFLRKNGLEQHPLSDAVAVISQFLIPVVEAASSGQAFQGHWPPGGAWNTDG